MEKARDLFWEKGYNSTSMQDVVEAMQLNRGSIYDTYGDKHALFLQCLVSYTRETVKLYRTAATRARSPMKAIENVIYKAVERTLEEGKACMVVKSTFELLPTDKAVHAIIKAEGDELIALFRELLAEAQQAGDIPAHKDLDLLARFTISSFAGLWQTNITYNDQQLIYKLADYLIYTIKA